jgi:glutathione-regulated potassium-efflux system ancillary protein KefG
MNPKIDTEDLVDAVGVAEILGLAKRTSVSVYQRRYPDMPRPVVDLGRGRPQLWSRRAVEAWHSTSSPGGASAKVAEELAALPNADRGGPMSHYRAVYQMVRRSALGPNPEGLPRSKEYAEQQALEAARLIDPTFVTPKPQFAAFTDSSGKTHRLILTSRENAGVVFVPAPLVHSEPSLSWIRERHRLTMTGGVSGDPVFKPSRVDWILYMDPGRLLPTDSAMPWFSLFLQNDQRMAQVYRQRVPGPSELVIGETVAFEKAGYRVEGTVVEFDESQARIKLRDNAA